MIADTHLLIYQNNAEYLFQTIKLSNLQKNLIEDVERNTTV